MKMNSTSNSYPFGIDGTSSILPGISSFTAYNLLRNTNYFLESASQESHLKALREVPTAENSKVTKVYDFPLFSLQEKDRCPSGLIPKHVFEQPYGHSLQLFHRDSLERALSPNAFKKQRSEKRPIPDEQKDDRYFERRRRNNQAAKKSRDARKMREDQIALKATILEHENAILRAQVLTLREEASSLRQMLMHRKPFEVPTPDAQLCVITP